MRDKDIASEKLNVDVFRKLKVFEGLPASELQNLATKMKQLRVKRSRTMEGLPANDLYVLLSGVVKISATNGATGHRAHGNNRRRRNLRPALTIARSGL